MSKLKWYSVRWGFFGSRIFNFVWISACVVLQLCVIVCTLLFCLFMIPFEQFSKTPSDSPLFARPVPLVNQRVAQIKGVPIEANGFSFVVPWDRIESSYLNPNGKMSHFMSDDHKILNISSDFDSDIILDDSKYHPLLSFLEGVNTGQSHYSFLTEILNTTPDQTQWWMSRRAQLRIQNRLLLKEMILSTCDKIESVQFGNMHGYQFTSSKLRCNLHEVDLTDAEDRHITITYMDVQTKSCDEIQEQVNAIVASIKVEQK